MNEPVFNGYTAEQLESQYNARAAVPGHEEIFEKWKLLSAEYRLQSQCRLDIAYSSSERGTLDLFLPRQADAPVHIFIHGGYWRAMDKSDFSFLAKGLVDGGALVAVVNYGRCPAVSMADIVEQMRDACHWLWRNCTQYGGNPEAIHVSGHSAGGHLTAMMMATEWPAMYPDIPLNLVKSGVAVSGLFELEPMRLIPLNDDLHLDEKNARLYSPAFLKPLTDAPLSIVVGGEESDEFRRQSYDFVTKWGKRMTGIAYLELPDLNHFTIIDQMNSPGNPLTEIMLRHMALVP
jgi:arylformamidase